MSILGVECLCDVLSLALSLALTLGAVLPESHTTGVTARLALGKDGIHILQQNDGLFRSLVQPRVERCVVQPAHKKQQQQATNGGGVTLTLMLELTCNIRFAG